MFKRLETQVVHRGRYYFVTVREYRKLFGFRIWEGKWHQTAPQFITKTAALDLARNIDRYLRGRYNPKSAR